MAVYITAVSGGNCVTRVHNNILNKKPTKDKNQLWTIEHKDGSNTQIAIRSNADGKYLRAKAGNAYGAVEVGGRQWWEVEDGPAHGSYWLKSLDFPNAYLCNANGSYIDDNKIYMWPKQANWTHALTFYLQDAKASGFLSQDASGDGEADIAKLKEELKTKEAAMAKKETEFSNKEADFVKREQELAKKAQASSQLSEKATQIEQREKELAAREKEIEAQKADLEARLKAQGSRPGKGSASSPGKDAGALVQQQQELAKKLAALESREKAVAQREEELLNRSDAHNPTPSSDEELVKENKRLAAELAAAKKKISHNQNGVMVRFSSHVDGSKIVPPPSFSRPALKPPAAIRPAQNLPGSFDKRLLQRFEVGKTALKGN